MTEPTTDSTSTDSTSTDYEQGVAKLERELAFARRNGSLAVKQMYATLAKQLRVSDRELGKARRRADKLKQRLDQAEAETATARRRARTAEAELAALRSSATWRAGRAVVAVPARIARLRHR